MMQFPVQLLVVSVIGLFFCSCSRDAGSAVRPEEAPTTPTNRFARKIGVANRPKWAAKPEERPLGIVLDAIGRKTADFSEKVKFQSDRGNVDALVRLSRLALASGSSEKRMAVVQELGWHLEVEKAAIELLSYLSDEDEQVASAALSYVRNGVDMLADTPVKARLLTTLVKLEDDPADRVELLSNFESLKKSLALPALAELCESDNPAIAREAQVEYKFVADRPFVDQFVAEETAAEMEKRGE